MENGVTCPPSLPSLILGRSVWSKGLMAQGIVWVRSESKSNSLRSFFSK